MSSISISSGEGSKRSSRLPLSMRCQARGGRASDFLGGMLLVCLSVLPGG
jgi:hypothetical protein